MKHLFVILFIGFYSVAFAQPSLSWQKCSGGTDDDDATFISKTHDNGFVVAGSTYSTDGDITSNHGSEDVLIIRFDSANNVIWQKTYGGTLDEAALSIVETSDHGFVFTGYSGSDDGDVTINYGDDDIWVVKIDSSGNLIWQKTFGDLTYDIPLCVMENQSGNIMVIGEKSDASWYSDVWLLCLSQSGNLLWDKLYGGSDDDEGFQVIQTVDGGYMLGCATFSSDGDVTFNHGVRDVWLIKTDSSGNIQWQKTFGGSEDDVSANVVEVPGSGYAFAAMAESIDGDVIGNPWGSEYWIVKTDAIGNIVTQQSYGGTSIDEPYRMIRTSDNGFVVTGMALSNDSDVVGNHGGEDAWILKLDTNLILQWSYCAGGSDDEEGYGTCELNNGDFAVTGFTNSNDGQVSGNHAPTLSDIWTFRLSTSTGVPEIIFHDEIGVYPNPASSEVNVQFNSVSNQDCRITVNDVCGRCMLKKDVEAAKDLNKFQLDTRGFDSGIYFITINLDNKIFSKRIVIE